MANRVVVTGMGAITPLGNTVETFWEGLKKGKAATGPITKFDTSNSKIKLACEVKDFDPLNYMDFKAMKRMEPFAHFAVAAAKEAIESSGLDMTKEDPYRVGVIVSSGIGSLQAHEREQVRYEKNGKIAPMYIPMPTFRDSISGERSSRNSSGNALGESATASIWRNFFAAAATFFFWTNRPTTWTSTQ